MNGPIASRLPSAVCMASGAGLILYAVLRPGVWADGIPGPGLWPCVLGGMALLCGAVLPKDTSNFRCSRTASIVLGAALLWIALSALLGWQLASVAALGIMWRAEKGTLFSFLFYAGILIAAIWLGCGVFLKVPLPAGALWPYLWSHL